MFTYSILDEYCWLTRLHTVKNSLFLVEEPPCRSLFVQSRFTSFPTTTHHRQNWIQNSVEGRAEVVLLRWGASRPPASPLQWTSDAYGILFIFTPFFF